MLTAIRERDGTKVLALRSERAEGPFACPKCQSELILRKGRVRIHHFAHKPPVACEYGGGEGLAHMRAKWEIYSGLRKQHACSLEQDLGPVVADVLVDAGPFKAAIEVQISALAMDTILRRTSAYARLGVPVLWLPLYDEPLQRLRYAPRQWEKWLHATYFGRVCYWASGLKVVPVHFEEHQLRVAEGPAGESVRRSRRFRTPRRGPLLRLLSDFSPRLRRPWKGGAIEVPRCRLLMDRLQNWW